MGARFDWPHRRGGAGLRRTRADCRGPSGRPSREVLHIEVAQGVVDGRRRVDERCSEECDRLGVEGIRGPGEHGQRSDARAPDRHDEARALAVAPPTIPRHASRDERRAPPGGPDRNAPRRLARRGPALRSAPRRLRAGRGSSLPSTAARRARPRSVRCSTSSSSIVESDRIEADASVSLPRVGAAASIRSVSPTSVVDRPSAFRRAHQRAVAGRARAWRKRRQHKWHLEPQRLPQS